MKANEKPLKIKLTRPEKRRQPASRNMPLVLHRAPSSKNKSANTNRPEAPNQPQLKALKYVVLVVRWRKKASSKDQEPSGERLDSNLPKEANEKKGDHSEIKEKVVS